MYFLNVYGMKFVSKDDRRVSKVNMIITINANPSVMLYPISFTMDIKEIEVYI